MEIVKTKSEATGSADWLAIAVATAAGAGFVPKAPGTAGSVVGVAIYLALDRAGRGAYFPLVIIFFFIVGIWEWSRVEHMWGQDAQRLVLDDGVDLKFMY